MSSFPVFSPSSLLRSSLSRRASGFVAASQVATAIAGAAIGPAVTGITLGIVHQAGFNWQNGRNQAFNHAGNVAGAALFRLSLGGSSDSSRCSSWQACSEFCRSPRS